MYSPRFTRIYFALESLNSLATTFYFYYIYFFTGRQFGFQNPQNLALAAALGLCYGISSIIGGRLCQRRGYLTALKFGLGVMFLSIAAGAIGLPQWAHLALFFVGNFGMALTWPPLEALVSEEQPPAMLQRNIGMYNILWAAFGALGYFAGGALIRAWGFRAMFILPAAIQLLQFAIVVWVERRLPRQAHTAPAAVASEPDVESDTEKLRSPVPPQTFLRMAWLANPFAYLAINTVVALIPGIALRLGLSLMWAGFVGSIWQFVRTAGFASLWLWNGWHYRFRWLAAAFIGMSVSFVAMLIAPNVAVLIAAQVVFGLGLALIYYSSLYYSMHVGEAKGEHGGMHEAMIGAGCCAGPAVGAFTLHYLPQYPNSGTLAVGTLLLGAYGGLMWLRYRRERS